MKTFFFSLAFILLFPFPGLSSTCESSLLPPTVRQSNEYNCGPACLRSYFLSKDIDLSLRDLEKLLNTNSLIGTKGNSIVRLLRSYGIDSELRSNRSLGDLIGGLKNGHYYFMNIQAEGEAHWVLVIGFDGEFIIMDPLVESNDDYLHISWDSLKPIWYGGEGHHSAIEIKAPGPIYGPTAPITGSKTNYP